MKTKKKNVILINKNFQESLVLKELFSFFGKNFCTIQISNIGFPIIWINKSLLLKVSKFLFNLRKPYNMLFDLHGVDERFRRYRKKLPEADFSVFYHLISVERNSDIMIKVPLLQKDLNISTITDLFPNANWYERETWEMFGIIFDKHPNLTHIIMPNQWKGYPLRKDYPARATDHESFFFK